MRKNLNLLKDEFQLQQNRSKTAHLKSKGQLDDGSGYIDIFGPKKDGNINDSLIESEGDLNEDEMAILDEFDKND